MARHLEDTNPGGFTSNGQDDVLSAVNSSGEPASEPSAESSAPAARPFIGITFTHGINLAGGMQTFVKTLNGDYLPTSYYYLPTRRKQAQSFSVASLQPTTCLLLEGNAITRQRQGGHRGQGGHPARAPAPDLRGQAA